MSSGDYRPEPPSAETGAPLPGRELTCQDVIGLLLDYLEGALPPAALTEFERHLQDCPACLAYLKTYRRTRDLVSHAARVEMPTELKVRLRQLVRRHLESDPT